jgi:dGTPase
VPDAALRIDRNRTGTADRPDQRDPFERDRDRILYSSAFRRLAGITQVAHAAEGQVFHNRLTHTLKVAQIAQRLAEHRRRAQPELAEEVGLNAEVAQAAALAHDLGHPPFGHIAEEELDLALYADGVHEGFEGNAQSFRIVTKLAIRKEEVLGLDLSRATLDAILKYPRLRPVTWAEHQKFGAFRSETDDLEFARRLHPTGSEARSVEAELMDWADDIAYAVHDVEDFYRAGLLPLNEMVVPGREGDRFLETVFERWDAGPTDANERLRLRETFVELMSVLRLNASVSEPYGASTSQRAALRAMTSFLVSRYVQGDGRVAALVLVPEAAPGAGPTVQIDGRARDELTMLKRLTWEYVIFNPRLASQQRGQRAVVRSLYAAFRDSAGSPDSLLSASMRELLNRLLAQGGEGEQHAIICRVAADAVCRLTEDEALRLHRRIVGIEPGSIADQVAG